MIRQVVGIKHGVNIKVSPSRRLIEETEPEVTLKSAREQADLRFVDYYIRKVGLK